MRDKRDVMRLHIKNGIRDLDGIRESYNAFASGGNIYGGTTEKTNQMQLSPLQPKPQAIDYSFAQDKYKLESGVEQNKPYYAHRLRNMPVSEYTKRKILEESKNGYSLDSARLGRRIDINNLAGNPSYSPYSESDDGTDGGSFYNPLSNTIYGPKHLAEEAHGYRNVHDGSELVAAIKSYIKKPFITKSGMLENYNTPGQMEYDTHKVVQPVLEEYLNWGFPIDSIRPRIERRRSDINSKSKKR